MSRRNRIAQQRRQAELADPTSAVAMSTDPDRDQYARSRAMVDTSGQEAPAPVVVVDAKKSKKKRD